MIDKSEGRHLADERRERDAQADEDRRDGDSDASSVTGFGSRRDRRRGRSMVTSLRNLPRFPRILRTTVLARAAHQPR